ncbi:hypothetical protein [Pedobacter sp.]|uniref:hypothetical protein n=1 Tax=Pedobacter sp. TaxID=1411316 RepID=UPI003BACA2A8
MKKLYTLLLCSFLLQGYSYAQKGFFDKFSLRKSFQSKSSKTEAASFTFNKPKDATGSWAANLALGFQLLDSTTVDLFLFSELHKNTLVNKKQDSRDIGLAFRKDFFPLASLTPFLLANAKYNVDREKGNESFRASLSLSLKAKDLNLGALNFITPNKIVPVGNLFTLEYTPFIGLENENRTKTTNASEKGHIYRWYFQIIPVITLFPNTTIADRFELRADYQYRNDFSKSVQDGSYREHEFFTASFNYNILSSESEQKFQVGLDYVKGENPVENFLSQRYYAISLKVKL